MVVAQGNLFRLSLAAAGALVQSVSFGQETLVHSHQLTQVIYK
jgi:hypothetical protein